VPVAYEWTVFATLTSLVVAVVALLATALFQPGAKIDRITDRMDQRFDGVEARMREDKAELLGRMDVLAERITRLETG
jgi:hypothetical protein